MVKNMGRKYFQADIRYETLVNWRLEEILLWVETVWIWAVLLSYTQCKQDQNKMEIQK